jgi:hypothetical protein
LLYLFAAEVLPPVHFTLGHLFETHLDVDLPADGGCVALGPLEAHLFAWTFWQLHADGRVVLEHDESVKRGRDLDWLGMDCLVTRVDDELSRPGLLEEQVLGLCPKEARMVSKVIHAWGKARGLDTNRLIYLPLEFVVDAVHYDTCNALGIEPVEADHSAITATQREAVAPQFRELRAQWGAFVDGDRERAAALLRCCDAGLAQLRPPKYGAMATGI